MTPGEEVLLDQLEAWQSKSSAAPSSSSLANSPLKPYKFRMSEVEGFRYRVKVKLAW